MVECKDYAPGRVVGIDDVTKFSGILFPARGKAVDKGLFVTTNGFTREAREFALTAGIEAVTFSDLSTQLVNFDDYVEQVIREFEQAPVFNKYIDLTGADIEDYQGAPASVFHRPLDDLVNRYLFQSDHNRVALLGNFGTGKTTFCKKLAYDLARQYKTSPMSRIPIVIGLSAYESKLDIQELVTNTLQFRYGVRIDLTICQELQRLGRFFLLFDGFDEMASRVDADVIQDNLREVNKISQIPENKFIVTCRTHFFRDRVQADVLGDFDLIYIPEWGELELREYLQKYFGRDWKQQLDRIHGTHNLTELAETPLFLEMMVETLPKLGEQVRRSELYKAYTDKWIQEESRRRGARLNSDDRRRLITELAIKLYTEGKPTCHHSEFAGIVSEKFQVNDAAQIDYLQSDVRTCAFLTRDVSGNYGFRHKSFMEFFVAQILADQIRAGSDEHLSDKLLPLEITRFLIEELSDAPPEDRLKALMQSSQSEVSRQNVTSLLTRLKIDFLAPESPNEPIEEQETRLATRFLQGDVEAFNRLYVENRRWLVATVMGWTKDRFLAEDIVAGTFIRLWETRDRLEQVTNLKGYLHRYAYNMTLDQRRRSREGTSLSDPDEELRHVVLQTKRTPEAIYEETEEYLRQHHILERAIQHLKGDEKIFIEEVYLKDKTPSLVAQETGHDLTYVRRKLNRGKAKLRYRLKQEVTAYERAINERKPL